MKPITTANPHLKLFLCNCISSKSLAEFKRKLETHRTKINELFNGYDVFKISIDKGRFYLAFTETEDNIIILGYHLNNDDIDENGNMIFISGTRPEHIGKIHILVNKGVKL